LLSSNFKLAVLSHKFLSIEEQHMIVTIEKWGDDLAIKIPESVVQKLGLHEGSIMDMTVENDVIKLSPEGQPEYDLNKLLKLITPENRHAKVDFGQPQGSEVW
jgi:antitoxin MazE